MATEKQNHILSAMYFAVITMEFQAIAMQIIAVITWTTQHQTLYCCKENNFLYKSGTQNMVVFSATILEALVPLLLRATLKLFIANDTSTNIFDIFLPIREFLYSLFHVASSTV